MGAELPCRATVGDKSGEGTAKLETSELIFRGRKDFRFRIHFEDVKKVIALGDRLIIDGPGVHAVFELGNKYAVRWAEKIKNPPTRIDKLGVKPESVVCVLGVDDPQFRSELEARTKTLTFGKLVAASDFIFFGADKKSELPKLSKIKESLAPAGAIWIIRPKGATAITEKDVMTAGKAAGLVDVKVCKFSITHTAEKYVIPVADRT